MNSLSNYDLSALRDELARESFNPTHARAILRQFYHSHGRPDWNAIAVGHALQQTLVTHSSPRSSYISARHTSADGTTKLLIGFDAGGSVESVLMPGHRADRAAACVSSQIGCAMGCDFCASTRRGLERNLSAGEIVEQFLHLTELAGEMGRRVTSLVFMGMGEPMQNLDNVIAAIRRIADPDLGGLGWRQVTVSTVGIVPGIDALADADLNVHLAVSLHAPDDETRARLVPMNRRWGVADILSAARRFYDKTARIVTIEYCMLNGINDTDRQAALLASLLSGFRAHVNLIPYNSIGAGVSGSVYARPSPQRVHDFLAILRDAGVVAHIRGTRGDDVNAACGQLRG